MVLDNVACDGGGSEELQGEVFDGRLGFSINEEVGVYNSMVHVGEVASCKNVGVGVE